MAYINVTTLDSMPVNQCDVPTDTSQYTGTFAGETELHFVLPIDVKVCNVTNGTAIALYAYVSRTDGTTDDPATNLLTAHDTRQVVTIAAGESYPFVRNSRFNRIHLGGGAATGACKFDCGLGYANGLGTVATKAITGATF